MSPPPPWPSPRYQRDQGQLPNSSRRSCARAPPPSGQNVETRASVADRVAHTTVRLPTDSPTRRRRVYLKSLLFFFFPDRALCTTESTNGPAIYTGGYFVEFSATNASGTPDDDEIRTVRLADTDRIRRKIRLARDAHLRRLVPPVEENRGQTELENRIRWKGNAVRRSTVSRSVPRLSRTRMGTANRAHI